MRITLISTGSMGDVRPFVALGKHLKTAGHQVILAGPENTRRLARSQDLQFISIDTDTRARLRVDAARVRMDLGNTLQFAFHRLQSRRRLALRINRAAYRACQETDAIIYRIGGYLAGDSIAEKLGVPCFKAGLVPYSQTRAFPSLYLSPFQELGSIGNWLSYPLAQWLIWLFIRSSINEFRQTDLNLAALPLAGGGSSHFNHNLPILYAFSPSLLPKPADWPENAFLTGHWTLADDQAWQPPDSLLHFLKNGSAPVYIGFGSMVSQDARETYQTACKALEISGQRGVICSGWDDLKDLSYDPGKILLIKEAPHEWLFPQMSAAVHHGGIGTTINSLQAGLPTVIVPFNYDQPFWGKRVAALGVGPHPIPRRFLTDDNLAKAIRTSIEDRSMREHALRISSLLAHEDGTGKAVEIIQTYLGDLKNKFQAVV
jgi:UDP:flavonoid glycosyltransferase YjiC (YdhE family)